MDTAKLVGFDSSPFTYIFCLHFLNGRPYTCKVSVTKKLKEGDRDVVLSLSFVMTYRVERKEWTPYNTKYGPFLTVLCKSYETFHIG